MESLHNQKEQLCLQSNNRQTKISKGDTGMTQQWERQQDTKAVALFNKKIRAWGAKVSCGR